MRSLARRSASHSSSPGPKLKRLGASVAPGSISTRVAPHSTYVAIDRTPSDSAASGVMIMGVRPRPDSNAPPAVDREHAARDHRGLVGGEEEGRGGQILRLVEPPERHGAAVAGHPLLVYLLLAHEGGEHRSLGR